MSQIVVLGNRVLIEAAQREEKTKSGIVMPDSQDKESKAEGQVAGLGNGKEVKALGLKVGDHVIFEKWGGEEMETAEKKKYKILNHDKILAIIK